MNQKDRQFLSILCADLMGRFPEITAAFEGFVSPCLGGPRDGYLVCELFDVPDQRREQVLSFAEDKTEQYFQRGGRPTTFGIWSPQETSQYFGQDMEAVRKHDYLTCTSASVTVGNLQFTISSVMAQGMLCPPIACSDADLRVTGEVWAVEEAAARLDISLFRPPDRQANAQLARAA